MIKIEIRSIWGSILFSHESENNTVAETLVRANLVRANLRGANLVRANLRGANLDGANLRGANLDRANLDRANLDGANLDGANLRGANLDGANLVRANLDGANLRGANLDGANLDRANLDGANLDGANLRGANLDYYKHSLWATLLKTVSEIPFLKQSIIDGKINGSQYEGACCCLKGTIAKSKGCAVSELPGIVMNASAPDEAWFLQFKEGQTPENYGPMKLTLEWIEEFESWIALAKGHVQPIAPTE